MAAAGADVTVIATRREGDAAMFRDFDGVRYEGPIRYQVLQPDVVSTMKQISAQLSRSGARGAALWRAAQQRYGFGKRALRAWLLALPLDDYDIVHLEYTGLAVSWLDALPLRTRAKLVVSCRGAAEQITPLLEPGRGDQLREVFALCDRVHCVSADMLHTCEQYGLTPQKAFINRPAIDARRFRRSQPYVVRDRGPYHLLTTGRLHWKKGLEYALLAVRRLVDAGHDVRYEIVGAGREEESLRFAVHDLGLGAHVELVGRKSSTEVRAALERADIYLLPSLSEGISNAALEAMAMEVPLVTTTAGGMNEAVRDGIEAMVVSPRDPAALADRVAMLLADGPGRAALGRAARARIESEFSLERQVRVYVKEYDSLLTTSTGAAA